MEDNTTQIIIAVIALVTAIIGGALISINKSRKRSTKTKQDNIKIKGNKNKVIGGDDNSKG
jgi:glucose uptake protein GlcU